MPVGTDPLAPFSRPVREWFASSFEAPTEAHAVGPGMLVTVRPLDDDDTEDETYLLAEHAEEKASGARTVTITSPFGSALMGVAKGEEIVYQAPGGSFRYVVVGFEPHTG